MNVVVYVVFASDSSTNTSCDAMWVSFKVSLMASKSSPCSPLVDISKK